jgi:hypothetical protein
MKLNGQYVGLGLGDASSEVQSIKAFMRRKFSYAKTLADDPVYDQPMTAAVATMQANYDHDGKLPPGKYNPGIINAETKYVMGYLKRPPGPDVRPVLLTVCGTGVPWWVGPDADTARAVEFKYLWRPVGYRAAPFPMGKSIDEAVVEAIRIMEEERARIEKFGAALAGYSQGAYIISVLWETHIKPANGRLHWAFPHINKAVAWGNPKRQVGKSWPDPGAEMAAADTGGVDEELMVDTPDWWRNYAHVGDLYTAAKDDESRENKTAIWKVIRGSKVFSGPDSLLMQVLEVLGVRKDANQITEAIGIFKAILDAGMFFGKGTGPHLNYNVGPAIDYLRA